MFAPKRVGEQLMGQTQSLISFNPINIFGEQQMTEHKLVQHHVKYKEIHGEDIIKMLSYSEHKKLHIRLRKEGKCTIPVKELKKIVAKAHKRTKGYKTWNHNYNILGDRRITFIDTPMKNIQFIEEIRYNEYTGEIGISCDLRICPQQKGTKNVKRKMFYTPLEVNIRLVEQILINVNNNNIYVSSNFSKYHGKGLKMVHI